MIIGSEQGTTFPTKVGSTLCNALIDTGATKSCMSESYYKTLQLNSIRSVVNTRVRSATGSTLSPLGIVNCPLKLGNTMFNNDFIVCQNLTRPLILGKDFLMKNQITVKICRKWEMYTKRPTRGIGSNIRYNQQSPIKNMYINASARKNIGCYSSQ